MKIILELEIGVETGVIVGALEEQIKMLKQAYDSYAAYELQSPSTPTPFLAVTERLLKKIENEIERVSY